MSSFAFDANIVIDALVGREAAIVELERAAASGGQVWMSRMAWIEILSKGEGRTLRAARDYLSHFSIDEIDAEIADRAAALRRERPRLRSPDAIILASANVRGRILVTRNTKDFPASMPGIRVPYTL
ncbi:PIN domain-containing protein [Novosphingobium sp. BL-52-GroH]|uniref:PIN domain-containing protein n=1 Tax=Novosphingobium sp. BL-52-GroH TaxID=3349877 RepID=UPI0038516960